jgi:DnaJ family protein C protein 28
MEDRIAIGPNHSTIDAAKPLRWNRSVRGNVWNYQGDRTVLKNWESLIDKKIREAMERGEFENLAGKGEPIDLSENPYEDPDWRTAHRMLRNAGFAPAWIEERKDIDAELAVARSNLARVWTVRQNARNTEHESSANVRWQKGLDTFRERVAELNRRINAWNLKAPAVGFQRKRIDVETEIRSLQV